MGKWVEYASEALPEYLNGFFSMGPNSRLTKSCDTSQILRYLHRPADLANISHCLKLKETAMDEVRIQFRGQTKITDTLGMFSIRLCQHEWQNCACSRATVRMINVCT